METAHMRFTSQQDYNLMLHFNKELINTFMDVTVVLYKLNIITSKRNVYNESVSKKWYRGVQVPCMVDRQLNTSVKDAQIVNVEQASEFQFLRRECEDRGVYPENGDIIEYHNLYFEIDHVNEVQLIAGQTIYNHAIITSAHLTRATGLQLEAPIR